MTEQLQTEIQSLLNWHNKVYSENLTELPDKDKHFWKHISLDKKLSEEFIREFKDKVVWDYISSHQKLSEEFISEFHYKVEWLYISQHQKLSESFIRKFIDKVYGGYISIYQKLSEEFIREFKYYINWINISQNQKLSESFIREFKDEVNWVSISKYQKLSEEFIRVFKDKVYWTYISRYQKLSEGFIGEFKDKVDWVHISRYQKLSDEFWEEFKEQLGDKPTDNLLYWTNEQKLELLKQYPQYKIENNYVYAFKGIRSDRYSKFNFQFKYEVGKIYECHADHVLGNENSFGLSCWTYDKAKEYCDELVIKVRFKIEHLAAVVHEGGKLRVSKFEVLT
jgi:hypothetical protein